MATIVCDESASTAALIFPLSAFAGQTGNVDTTNVGDRGTNPKANSTKVRVTQSVGATPTCTYTISVSPTSDSSGFVNATYADISTPSTDVSTTFVLTGGGVQAEKIVKVGSGWRWIKVTSSANTNVTFWVDLIVDDLKRWV